MKEPENPLRMGQLERALGFVMSRIEQEASLSGEPLHDDERSVLNDLPNHQGVISSGDVDEIVLRDTTYERLYHLAKAAHERDLAMNPSSAVNWDLAAAVTSLHGHAMARLLQWAGVTVPRRWGKLGLLIAAVSLLTVSWLALMLLVASWIEPGHWLQLAFSAAYVASLVALAVAGRRRTNLLRKLIEQHQHSSNVKSLLGAGSRCPLPLQLDIYVDQ